MAIKLYRFPKLRPPIVNGVSLPKYNIVVTALEKFPKPKITPRCFTTDIHSANKRKSN